MGRLLSHIFLLCCLTACQGNAEYQAEQIEKNKKRDDAVSYHLQLGMGYLKQGDIPRAKRKLLMAKALAPQSSDVNGALAFFYEKTNDVLEAQQYYQKAMLFAPGKGGPLNNYGAFLCRRGQYQEAESWFLKAVKDAQYLNPAGAYENAGLCATAIPNNEKAIHYFQIALAQDGQRVQSLYELTRLLLKQQEYEKALSFLQKYPKLVYDSPPLLALAIDCAKHMKRLDLETDYVAQVSQLERQKETGVNHEYEHTNI